MRPKITILFLLLILLILRCEKNSASAEKQDDPPDAADSTMKYLGLNPPGFTPEVFAPGFISINGSQVRESDINFWPDGLRCIFARFGDNIPDFTIFESRVVNGSWTQPEPSSLFSNGAFEPGISPDGKKILFSPAGFVSHGEQYIHSIEQEENGWSAPEVLFKGIYPSITNDGTVYYTALISGKDHIAYRKYQNGAYQEQIAVGANIFSEFEDAHPFISADEDFLFFDSEDRPYINNCALFISFKQQDSTWSVPVNMGTQIRIANASLARVTPDGKYLFFKSSGEIYWVDAEIIDSFRN